MRSDTHVKAQLRKFEIEYNPERNVSSMEWYIWIIASPSQQYHLVNENIL